MSEGVREGGIDQRGREEPTLREGTLVMLILHVKHANHLVL